MRGRDLSPPSHFDAVVVGGGPAGSSCARAMHSRGLRVAVLDRARFPRLKLCAGWLSAPVWEELEVAADRYPGGLWRWNHCHVYLGGERHTIDAAGYFIRRIEFDEWLLGRSGAEVFEHAVKRVERDGEEWLVDGRFRARYLVGAGGTHCPVARAIFASKPRPPVGAQEHEFKAPATEIAATRLGDDGEPELLLRDDLSGYAWNVPKSDWLNVGCGTADPKQVRAAWQEAKVFFEEHGHLPAEAHAALDDAKGHAYYLFDPRHLEACERDGAFLVGDALGLAHPLTAEGILPAIVSGRLCGEAVADGAPLAYPQRLRAHPLMSDYDVLFRLRERGAALRARRRRGRRATGVLGRVAPPAVVGRLGRKAVASGFAWMFAGHPLPARPLHSWLRRL